MEVMLMSRKKCKPKINKFTVGLIVASVGIGIVIAVILPVWGWVIAAGGGLIFFGWCLIENCCKRK
ncbi:hypothetical protein CUB90_01575 [Clostridium sp. CT7]|nr:hypothetical protein CUB90_01575 [Clostridium sp. CT7]